MVVKLLLSWGGKAIFIYVWDFAAPEAALKAAGGAITSLNNEELIYGKPNFEQGGIIVASSNFKNHQNLCLEIKEIIKQYDIFPVWNQLIGATGVGVGSG